VLSDLSDNDFFSWKGLKIYQDHEVLKVGTDAVLLGSWISQIIPKASKILDAGTGSGILAMVLSLNFPEAHILAVDVDQKAVALAQWNVMKASLENRVTVIKADLMDKTMVTDHGFDLIICNPPYYTTRVLPRQEYSIRAKHSLVPIADWINSLLTRLNQDGHLSMIVPAEGAHQWISAANEKGYYVQHRVDVYSFANDLLAKRVLLHFGCQLKQPEFRKLVLYAEAKKYTTDYLKWSDIKSTQNADTSDD
jgi:tRNA1Val (adenine37-N6)-methyltransferase